MIAFLAIFKYFLKKGLYFLYFILPRLSFLLNRKFMMLFLLHNPPFCYFLVNSKRYSMTVCNFRVPHLYKPPLCYLSLTLFILLHNLSRFRSRLRPKLKYVFEPNLIKTKVLSLYYLLSYYERLSLFEELLYHLVYLLEYFFCPSFNNTPCWLRKSVGSKQVPRRWRGLRLHKRIRRRVHFFRYLYWLSNPPLLMHNTPPSLPILCNDLWLRLNLILLKRSKNFYHHLIFLFYPKFPVEEYLGFGFLGCFVVILKLWRCQNRKNSFILELFIIFHLYLRLVRWNRPVCKVVLNLDRSYLPQNPSYLRLVPLYENPTLCLVKGCLYILCWNRYILHQFLFPEPSPPELKLRFHSSPRKLLFLNKNRI